MLRRLASPTETVPMRLLPLVLLGLLAGCTPTQLFGIPPDRGPEFGVSSLQGPLPEPYASFNRVGPEATARHAANICTLGYRTTGEKQMKADPGTIVATHVRCRDYVPPLGDVTASWLPSWMQSQ
jgi:hypothetical protein